MKYTNEKNRLILNEKEIDWRNKLTISMKKVHKQKRTKKI